MKKGAYTVVLALALLAIGSPAEAGVVRHAVKDGYHASKAVAKPAFSGLKKFLKFVF